MNDKITRKASRGLSLIGLLAMTLPLAHPAAADPPGRDRGRDERRDYRSQDHRKADKEYERRLDERERERDKREAELERERDKRAAESEREQDKREAELQRERYKRQAELARDRGGDNRSSNYRNRRGDRPGVRVRSLPPRSEDWDRDGVPNRRDRYPRNPDRS